MRIKLSNPSMFFDQILDKNKINLKSLAVNVNVNYSNLKQYRRGEKTLPSEVFQKLIQYSPRKEFWLKDMAELQDNWGAIKGGLKAVKSDPYHLRLIKARRYRKIPYIDIKMNEFFCEFYGALLGDGCITKYKDWEDKERISIFISGNKSLDHTYLKYLKNALDKEYGLYSYYYEYKDKNICHLSIKNKNLCIRLNEEFGVPIGLKYDKLGLSHKILNLDWNLKKFTIRGLFDTDGCILANKRENYRYPWVIITSKSLKFLEQIKKLLREQGYPAYITNDKDVCVRGIKNVKRWFEDIGSSNPRNIKKYEYFLKHGSLPARLTGLW